MVCPLIEHAALQLWLLHATLTCGSGLMGCFRSLLYFRPYVCFVLLFMEKNVFWYVFPWVCQPSISFASLTTVPTILDAIFRCWEAAYALHAMPINERLVLIVWIKAQMQMMPRLIDRIIVDVTLADVIWEIAETDTTYLLMVYRRPQASEIACNSPFLQLCLMQKQSFNDCFADHNLYDTLCVFK